MDPIKGAEMLWKRVGSAASERVEPVPSKLVPEDALPLFHWLGVEPTGVRTVDTAGMRVRTPAGWRGMAGLSRFGRRLPFRGRPS